MAGHDQAEREAYASLDGAIRAHGYHSDALLEVLHSAQRIFGRLSHPVLDHISKAMRLPPSKVLGVATFYSFFTFEPASDHECLVCMGTACYVGGAADVLGAVESELHVKAGRVSHDRRWYLRTAHCLGNCGHAPIVVVDDQPLGRSTPERVMDQIRATRDG